MQNVSLYELSARRGALIKQIPSYIAFPLRTSAELDAIVQQAQTVGMPDVPPEILALAAEVEIVTPPAEEGASALGETTIPVLLQPRCQSLSAMQQAKLTYFFVVGLRAYEAKSHQNSEKFLELALSLAPTNDILLARLADTCYAQYQAIRIGHEQASVRNADREEHWRLRTLDLYRKAIQ